MSDKLRLFIAIELDNSIRQELAAIQAKLKTNNADVKWVEPQNIHLTLKFLGDTPTDRINEIKASIDTAAKQLNPFEISLAEIGAFPDLNSPRVIWVGINDVGNRHACSLLADALRNKEFSAHLTLGRVRSSKNMKELKKIIEDMNIRRGGPLWPPLIKTGQAQGPAPTHVDHITLFQSTLTPKGPVYTNLYEATMRPIRNAKLA